MIREEYLHYFLNQYYLINNKITKVGTSVTIEINVFLISDFLLLSQSIRLLRLVHFLQKDE